MKLDFSKAFTRKVGNALQVLGGKSLQLLIKFILISSAPN
jgi:hypothetical protein